MARDSEETPIAVRRVQRLGIVIGLLGVLLAALLELGTTELPASAVTAIPYLGVATLVCAAVAILFGPRALPGIKLFLLGAAVFAIQPLFWAAVILLALWVLGNAIDLFDLLDFFS
ncbi:MAG: hypothetical protein H6713_41105 [Myxococcales bacterium]|nr:hypothetical protein [Myxococcales bacterium]